MSKLNLIKSDAHPRRRSEEEHLQAVLSKIAKDREYQHIAHTREKKAPKPRHQKEEERVGEGGGGGEWRAREEGEEREKEVEGLQSGKGEREGEEEKRSRSCGKSAVKLPWEVGCERRGSDRRERIMTDERVGYILRIRNIFL